MKCSVITVPSPNRKRGREDVRVHAGPVGTRLWGHGVYMLIPLVVAALLYLAVVALAVSLVVSRRRRIGRRATADAENVKRMAYVGELAGGLAHEIGNPLSSMNMNLQLLAEDLAAPTPPSHAELLQRVRTILREVRRLSDILDDFLRFARKPELSLAEENVNDIVDEVVEFISPKSLIGRVRIFKNYERNALPCLVDRDALKQALLNVLLNANEAMPDGGDLIVGTSRDKGFLKIEVTDTGVGITPEALARIFDAYHSTKKNGSGLGLATSRRIIEEHGGRILVHSEPGKGTRVSILLPIAGR